MYDEYAKQNGYDGISEDFKNKRALVNDLIVVQENGKYGIYALDSNSENNTGKEIINTRYDSLEYVGNINQFIAKYSGKFGILSPEKEELTLPIEYDSLEFLSSEELMLYIVSKNNKYGVISGNGDKIVPVEFERIGLNKLDDFSEQNITNPYILFDKYIVVYSNEKYGLYSVDGTETTMETVYESLGCIAKDTAQFVVDQNRNVQMSDLYNTLIIDAKSGENVVQGIVVKYQGHYGVVGLDGKVLIPTEWDTIFFLKNKEGLTYYLASTEKAVTINQLLGI